MKKTASILIFSLLFVISSYSPSDAQQSSSMYLDAEITLQTQNMGANDVVKFTLKPVGDAFMWDADDCEYYSETMSPAIHEITGNHDEDDYYYTIDHDPSLSSNFEFLYGKMEIKVEVVGGDPDTCYYFYWDVADCQYYNPTCPGNPALGPPGDIILRYDDSNMCIWFYWGNDPANDPPTGWENVNGLTKRWIDYAKLEEPTLTECPLTPATPTGFSISGSLGENPVLSWNANQEQMLDGYNLYRSLGGVSYSLLTTLGSQATSFTDQGVVISNGRFDPSACYKLTAFGLAGNESISTFPKCKKYDGLNKENISEETDEKMYKNSLIGSYPNPFNPSTTIRYELAQDSYVKLEIYDTIGKKIASVVNKYESAGSHDVSFDGTNFASGIYIYRLEVGSYSESKMFQILK